MLVEQYKGNGMNTFPGIIIINDKILGNIAIGFPFLAIRAKIVTLNVSTEKNYFNNLYIIKN